MKILLLTLCCVCASTAIELTFIMPEHANQCFYEEIKSGIDFVIEYQVVTGGQYDIDTTLEDPNGETLYKEVRKQLDSVTHKAKNTGPYKLCFSNEFSTFTHKTVYMDWQINDKDNGSPSRPIPRMASMGQLEMSAAAIGDRLRIIDDYQTHHRLREASGRKRAEDLNERVFIWSLGQTAVVIIIGIGQVLLLRSFFSDKKPIYY